MKSKEKIIATLKKLKAMAERGCNEQEIETAARMLQKQMDKYGITLDELRDEKKAGAECETTDYKTQTKSGGDMDIVLARVAYLFDCKSWYWNKQDWQFFGLPGDTQAAVALAFLIEASVKSETRAYTKTLDKWTYPSGSYEYNCARRDFRRGFLWSVAQRLHKMKEEQIRNASKNALVVRKQDIIKAALDEKGLTFNKARKSQKTVYGQEHYSRGRQVGDQANLNVGGQLPR